jgi:multidrug efflux pump subunit AcrA (membrane-fusion protein)
MKSSFKLSQSFLIAVSALYSSATFAYTIETVKSEEIGKSVAIGGTVIPYKEVTLAAQVPGRVQYIFGEEGDLAQESDVLISIGDDDLRAKRRQAVAGLKQAETALKNAQVQYSKELWSPKSDDINTMPGMGMPSMFDKFFTRNVGSAMGYGNNDLDRRADLFSQGTRVSTAKSVVLQARSSIDQIDSKLRDTKSISAFNGVIVKKFVELGDTVQPGTPLIRIAQTEFLRIKAEIPARLVPGLVRGSFVDARLDVGNTHVKARISQIYPVANEQKHTVTVKFDLPKGIPGGPGMYAEIRIPDFNVTAKPFPVVTKNAVVYRGSLPYIFVMDEEEGAEIRIVRTGSEVGESKITILSGVKNGEKVVVNPPLNIKPGWKPEEGKK